MSLRGLDDPHIYEEALVDSKFVSFMNRHEPDWKYNLRFEDIVLSYKIWYHSQTYKPDLQGINRSKQSAQD